MVRLSSPCVACTRFDCARKRVATARLAWWWSRLQVARTPGNHIRLLAVAVALAQSRPRYVSARARVRVCEVWHTHTHTQIRMRVPLRVVHKLLLMNKLYTCALCEHVYNLLFIGWKFCVSRSVRTKYTRAPVVWQSSVRCLSYAPPPPRRSVFGGEVTLTSYRMASERVHRDDDDGCGVPACTYDLHASHRVCFDAA